MHINTVYKENSQNARAEIYQGPNGYFIEYYDARGLMITKEQFPDKSIYYVQDAAENWVKGLKVLNG